MADLFGVATGDHVAVVEHDDVVGDVHHHAHVMLDQQYGDPVVVAQVADDVAQGVGLGRVEAGGRFVQADEFRPRAHGPAISRRRCWP